MKRAFTLIELLVVMAIMGLLGTVSVGGYRAIRRGMEERGVMANVNQFIRTAFQRSQIDRQPVAVYFWNELIQEETDFAPRVVVGRAVAVRRAGHITEKTGDYLCDEFGDLRFMRLSKSEDEQLDADSADSGSTAEGNGMYLYHLENGDTGFKRSIVSQTTKLQRSRERLLGTGGEAQIESYAFVLVDANGVSWKRGDAYGFEFADIQLPHNFVFGSNSDCPEGAANAVKEVAVLRFVAGRNDGNGTSGGVVGSDTVQVSNLRPDASGALRAEKVATSESPTRQQ